jgi:hypothetical protein
MDKSFDDSPYVVDDYIQNIQHCYTERESYSHTQNNSVTDPNFFTESFNITDRTPEKNASNQSSQHYRASSSGSLIKYFKNIFKSGK